MDAEQTPAANPDQFSYEETLWWRATRSKPVTVGGTVLPRALDRAWAAFVERWNTETGAEFVRMLERRETTHERLSLGALARRVCELSWEADRIEWKRISAETPLSDTELEVISQYEQALQASSRAQGAKRGAPPRRVENLPLTRGLPHTPLRSPERRPQAPHGAPSYQAWTQPVHEIFKMWRNFAIALDPREEPGRHAGMVDQGRREEAATAQLLDRLAQPLHRVEHENAELHRRVRQQEGAARREPPREDPRNAGA
ncbi:hypothetical protein PC120_g22343 [Phytophthora cactorum]|nr:hypothetical protein PC120_g22343 [Phytophthora cactorum]